MSELTELRCVPCRGDAPPLSEAEIDALKPQLPAWEIVKVDGIPRLQRAFKFKNFALALAYTNRVGELAEAEDHHPALLTEWGRVTVSWWTHAIKGLHQNDFIMAAKTEALFESGG